MNILPHKSWHVRRRDNIERVRRDEAKAAEEEKERLRRAALAEQEARTDLLRSKSRKRLEDGSTVKPVPVEENTTEEAKAVDIYNGTGGHINFFKDAEEGIAEKKKNEEHEKERKEEKEKWEKKMGILTYLGQSSTEDPTPWYLSKRRKREEEEETNSARKERDERRKEHIDPIHDLKKYVEKSKDSRSPDKKHKHKHKEKKKHKHKSKDKERTKSSSSSVSMEQLRAERLKREAEEKRRTEELIARHRGEIVPEKREAVQMDDRKRGYNSQYNPDFVRLPKDRY